VSGVAGGRAAVFLDRDGTLVEDLGFLHRPEDVRLLPGAGAAVARLNRAGLVAITVSNQSGIARGRYLVADYAAVQRRLGELLDRVGARLDGAYYCPHHPDVTGPCACRKPGTALFAAAAADHGLDLGRCWFVGDRASDVEPARALGGRGVLVTTGEGQRHTEAARAQGVPVVADVAAAVEHILTQERSPLAANPLPLSPAP
jgi:D-glycero-D-manno-heptose 1,7-bisphosphate phosphatase